MSRFLRKLGAADPAHWVSRAGGKVDVRLALIEKLNMEEIFESVPRAAGDLAGVFEFDGETSYFYLYDMGAPDNSKVVSAVRILTGAPDFSGMDIAIKWDCQEQKVGLFIKGELWAVIDPISRKGFGGDYRRNAAPNIAGDVASSFPHFPQNRA